MILGIFDIKRRMSSGHSALVNILKDLFINSINQTKI
jgi:hypothetical protein